MRVTDDLIAKTVAIYDSSVGFIDIQTQPSRTGLYAFANYVGLNQNDCTEEMNSVCPNCSGELVRRPTRNQS